MTRFLTVLFLYLAILFGFAGTASAAFLQPQLENRVGGFEEFQEVHAGVEDLFAPDLRRENTILCYDPATDVWFYVVQNPWTAFDPNGLSWVSWVFGQGYSGATADAFDSGFVEGIKESKVAKWAYTGNANASSESMNVAVDSVGKDLSNGISNTYTAGSGESGKPGAVANASLSIWNPDTAKLDIKIDFSAKANAVGFQEGNTKGGLLGGSISFGANVNPSENNYGLNLDGEVHGFTADTMSPVMNVPGTDASGALGGGFTFLGLGAEAGFNINNTNQKYNGKVGAGAELFNLTGVGHFNQNSNPGAWAGSGELAFGTSFALGVGVKNGAPPVEKARGKVVSGLGGGVGYEQINDEKVGEY